MTALDVNRVPLGEALGETPFRPTLLAVFVSGLASRVIRDPPVEWLAQAREDEAMREAWRMHDAAASLTLDRVVRSWRAQLVELFELVVALHLYAIDSGRSVEACAELGGRAARVGVARELLAIGLGRLPTHEQLLEQTRPFGVASLRTLKRDVALFYEAVAAALYDRGWPGREVAMALRDPAAR